MSDDEGRQNPGEEPNLLKDTVVCESLVHGPVREGPLLVISDMCGADRRLRE